MTHSETMQAFRRTGGSCSDCAIPIGKMEAELAVAVAVRRMTKSAFCDHRVAVLETRLEVLGIDPLRPLWRASLMAGLPVIKCAACHAKNVVANSCENG